MARKLKPCGTEAAYRRHLDHDEEPCQDCKRAAAEARDSRRDKKKAASRQNATMHDLAAPLFAQRRAPVDVPNLDPREEQFRMYSLLWTAVEQAAPRECAAIVKELRGLLADMTDAQPHGPSLADQLEEAKNRAKDRSPTATA